MTPVAQAADLWTAVPSPASSERLPERGVRQRERGRPPRPDPPGRLHQLLVLRRCWLVK